MKYHHISIILAVFALLGASCKKNVMDVSSPPLDRNLPDETSINVTITEFDSGNIDYILKAQKIDRFYDRRILNAYGALLTAFDAKTGSWSTMKADTTIVDDARNVIFANGNVFFSSANGSVAARRIVWDRNMDEITSPDMVTLVRAGSTMRGERLRTNSSISFAELDKVSAEGTFNESDFDW
ncbi:MAG: LPS export ABC transporter periplasmic protein LptC [Candidatus Cloacimonadaceae bacterium]|nr:LPS export ABC transporter periplasmic protein LptC [Candidatus Cloacimonadaceae bacterium]MDP3114225.1 LPS export ABC transporter periplasmic protein LptC [Candidatus Cloacimonadaceae bacterium]